MTCGRREDEQLVGDVAALGRWGSEVIRVTFQLVHAERRAETAQSRPLCWSMQRDEQRQLKAGLSAGPCWAVGWYHSASIDEGGVLGRTGPRKGADLTTKG